MRLQSSSPRTALILGLTAISLGTALTVVFAEQAPTAAKSEPPTTEIQENPVTAGDRGHWAFRPLVRPDEFIRLQVAGDELRPGDADAVIATGFLLCGPDMPDINDQEERRSSFLNDMTGTVSAAFLGLQIGCAQCHDHKYDPLSQADFY